MASGHREKRSTAVKQYLKPSDVGSGPTMSTYRCWNLDVDRAKSPNGVEVCLDTFDRWQAGMLVPRRGSPSARQTTRISEKRVSQLPSFLDGRDRGESQILSVGGFRECMGVACLWSCRSVEPHPTRESGSSRTGVRWSLAETQ